MPARRIVGLDADFDWAQRRVGMGEGCETVTRCGVAPEITFRPCATRVRFRRVSRSQQRFAVARYDRKVEGAVVLVEVEPR